MRAKVGQLITLLFTILLASSFVGSSFAGEVDQAPGQQRFVIGFPLGDSSDDWSAAQLREVREELAKYPFIRLIQSDAEGEPGQQAVDAEEMVAEGIDLLIVSPMDGKVMSPVISRIYNQGIPVVLLTSRIDSRDFTIFIGPDDRKIGRLVARQLVITLEGKGRVLILKGPAGSVATSERTKGVMEELDMYDGLSIAAVKTVDSQRDGAVQTMDEVLAEGIEFDAVYAQNDSLAAGASTALKRAGIDPTTIPTVGIGYTQEAREAIRAREQEASFTYPTCGKEGAQAAVKILLGKPVSRRIAIESTLVDRWSIDKVTPVY